MKSVFSAAGLLLVLCAAGAAVAGPFGVSHGAASAPSGIAGWILAEQARFYLKLSHLIRAAKSDGSATTTLLGISFIYGIFHAAGPGHGKAVISSYMVATNETWRRGVVLAFAAAVLQALTAIAIVGIAAVLLNATAKTMGTTVRVVEIVSYALIVLVGLRLAWVKGRAFLRLLRGKELEHHSGHDHAHHHDHPHHHPEDDASAWGHAHAPEPVELGGRDWWKRGLAAIVAVGLRPCSGAVIVLVFALAQGLLWTGVASTFVMGLGTAITVAAVASLAVWMRDFAGRFAGGKAGIGLLIVRGLETAAAVAIVLFGVALLTGYIASERMGLF
jgi:nickel/cobalt exporter